MRDEREVVMTETRCSPIPLSPSVPFFLRTSADDSTSKDGARAFRGHLRDGTKLGGSSLSRADGGTAWRFSEDRHRLDDVRGHLSFFFFSDLFAKCTRCAQCDPEACDFRVVEGCVSGVRETCEVVAHPARWLGAAARVEQCSFDSLQPPPNKN